MIIRVECLLAQISTILIFCLFSQILKNTIFVKIDHMHRAEFAMFSISIAVLDWLLENTCVENREADYPSIIHRDDV